MGIESTSERTVDGIILNVLSPIPIGIGWGVPPVASFLFNSFITRNIFYDIYNGSLFSSLKVIPTSIVHICYHSYNSYLLLLL